ncbi:hypothetical protein EXA18_15970 [Vibrio cincinnatiensis]|uniref:hypothetical protein n=1 Tax=Vibrio cincinnatiensis TaxID=675 RepID=UPI001EE05FCF|nr:hypothetical protein [Vibrio cincinnatiensis]MCG3744940.1 hypothetical protein [Vibrio cincinnatiensis]
MSKNHSSSQNSPSEIFKLRAKQFSSLITKISGFSDIPSKKRYDWLAHAIGYKDHSDLLHSNYLKRTTDNRNILNIFSKKKQREKIINVFFSNLPTVSKKHISDATILMAIIEKPEYKTLLISLINSGIRYPSMSKLITSKNNKTVTYKLNKPRTKSAHQSPLHNTTNKHYIYPFSKFRESYVQIMLSEELKINEL